MRKIFLGADHGGYRLKQTFVEFLKRHYPEIQLEDSGTFDGASVDYPDIAQSVAQAVAKDAHSAGILICGTGNGMAIAANKIKGIRAALVFNAFTGEMAKAHNHANVICIGERSTPEADALAALKAWLDTAEAGDRHQRRVRKLADLEN